MKNNKGFTLIELLAVIVILAIILVIAIPAITNQVATARQQGLDASARGVYKSLEATVNMYSLGLGTDLAVGTLGTTACPTTAWSAANQSAQATCTYAYTVGGNLSSLQVRMVANATGKFKGATTVDYTGN